MGIVWLVDSFGFSAVVDAIAFAKALVFQGVCAVEEVAPGKTLVFVANNDAGSGCAGLLCTGAVKFEKANGEVDIDVCDETNAFCCGKGDGIFAVVDECSTGTELHCTGTVKLEKAKHEFGADVCDVANAFRWGDGNENVTDGECATGTELAAGTALVSNLVR
jgi:hypothetical protein